MSISNPVLFIDGRATSLLKRLTAAKSGNTFFAPSKQASMYGRLVSKASLPNGLASKVTIGTVDNEGVRIPLDPSEKVGDNAVRGQIEVEVEGKKMTAYVCIRDKGETYSLIVRVTNQRAAKVFTEDEVFTVV